MYVIRALRSHPRIPWSLTVGVSNSNGQRLWAFPGQFCKKGDNALLTEHVINFHYIVIKAIIAFTVAVLVIMFASWGIIYNQSANIIEDRLYDLTYIVSEDNCLSSDGVIFDDTIAGHFEQLLENSETDWLKFDTHTGENVGFDYRNDSISYYVGNKNGRDRYMSYLDAPQRGEAIIIKVRGYVHIPMIISPFAASQEEANAKRFNIVLPLEKTYVTTGMKFFKDK